METATNTNELIKIVESSGVEKSTAASLKEKFLPFFEKAEEWAAKAKTLTVTSADQKREMQEARVARLALRDIRLEADKTRKALKEDSLRYGKAVQGVYNVIEYLIAPIEQHLENQEKFVEIQEAKRRAEVAEQRKEILLPLSEFVPMGIDLVNMTDSDFKKIFDGATAQRQAKIDLELKAEHERIAKEKAEAEEREKQRVENEKLKKEAEERERLFAIERAKAEAERKAAESALKAEREAKARIEAEMKAKAEAERKAKEDAERKAAEELKAKAAAEKKAKAAPDKNKLIELAAKIGSIEMPEMKSEQGKEIIQSVEALIAKLSKFITDKTNEI